MFLDKYTLKQNIVGGGGENQFLLKTKYKTRIFRLIFIFMQYKSQGSSRNNC